ncbi:MAG TPA: M20 family metallo-hydrolase [Thermoplasmata archaeon]|nr:M20 family metallo-hydrolase [Thermoplasmata archaeon]
MGIDETLDRINKMRDNMVSTLTELCRIPAIGPTNGGEGEVKKAAFVQNLIKDLGLKVERFDAPDKRLPGGKRPNLVARVGKGPRLWFLCHMDIVPPGEAKGWRCDPFDPKVFDGRLYGRGTEDNGQALVSVLSAYQALLKSKTKPGRALGFAFVSDEETGSTFGAKHLLTQDLFEPKDVFVVPDWGMAEGDEVEIAEKSVLWLKITVTGKQGHASTPNEAVNAHRAGAFLTTAIDANLPGKFRATDPLFRPWNSTFEPTKHEPNVPNVNTIPGEDVFYFDCRVLPVYKTKEVVAAVQALADQTAQTFGVKVVLEATNQESSPPTATDAPIVRELLEVLRRVRNLRAKPVGIGGGTVAGPLREEGFPCVVWSTTDETGHTVNEYAKVDNLVADAKVFAALMAGPA